jgi:pSer/pThr/pTyr-binding forkhead associated (FHA) protein
VRRHDNADAGHLLLRWEADGEAHDQRFSRPLSIGRDAGNEVTLPDRYVSRYHAVLWAENGRWHVRDLDSTNGTYIEDKRIKGIATLPLSCELRFHPKGPVVGVHVHKVAETAISTDFLDG